MTMALLAGFSGVLGLVAALALMLWLNWQL